MAERPVKGPPYSRAELEGDPAFPPLRGLWCPHCDMRIPQFADLSDALLGRILSLLDQQRVLMAAHELQVATGSPLLFARLWVSHRGRPVADGVEPPPCPYCGKPLRTVLARQCRHCKRDWHSAG